MMKKVLLVLWTMLPLAVFGWYTGPGNELLRKSEASNLISHAKHAAKREDWQAVVEYCGEAKAKWPNELSDEARSVALCEAQASILAGDLVVGQEQLQLLIDSMTSDPPKDKELIQAARHELGKASYYAAWMMRLEGAEADEWLAEAENARQQFRFLAEEFAESNDAIHQAALLNVEATIRLEQMDLTTLMAKPLPKNCCSNCKNLCQNKRKQAASKCKGSKEGEEEKKKEQELRQQIKKSNSAGGSSEEGVGS